MRASEHQTNMPAEGADGTAKDDYFIIDSQLLELVSGAGTSSQATMTSEVSGLTTPLLAPYLEQAASATFLSSSTSVGHSSYGLPFQQPFFDSASPDDLRQSLAADSSIPALPNLQGSVLPVIALSAAEESPGHPLNIASNIPDMSELLRSQAAGAQAVASDLFADNSLLSMAFLIQPTPAQLSFASLSSHSASADKDGVPMSGSQIDMADSPLSNQLGWLQRGTSSLLLPQFSQAAAPPYGRAMLPQSPHSLPSHSPALSDRQMVQPSSLLIPLAANMPISQHCSNSASGGQGAATIAADMHEENPTPLCRLAAFTRNLSPAQGSQQTASTVNPQDLTTHALSAAYGVSLSMPNSPFLHGMPANQGSPFLSPNLDPTANVPTIQVPGSALEGGLRSPFLSAETSAARRVAGQPTRSSSTRQRRRGSSATRSVTDDDGPHSDGEAHRSRHMTTAAQRKAYYQWIIANIHHPYPEDRLGTNELNIDNQNMSQFKYWFSNTRRRQMMLVDGNRYRGTWAVRPAFLRACHRIRVDVPEHIKRWPDDLK